MNEESLKYYFNWLNNYFVEQGMNAESALGLSTLINLVGVVILVLLVDFVTRNVIVSFFRIFSGRTKTSFDNFLVKSNFPRYVAHFIPLGILWYLESFVFSGYPFVSKLLVIILKVYAVVLSVLVFRSILRSTSNYLKTKDRYSDKPLESYIQVLMIFAWGVGIFFIVNTITGYSIISLTTFGAVSAALLLIFRDTILGFVASIQVSVNDIVRIGDWITFSKYGADGVVSEINLATVRVQNFDNTYTTIPTYSLISDSFQNWRGMQESDGRRIKRALFIAQDSIRFVTSEDLDKFRKITLVSEYIDHRQKDIDKFNTTHEVDKELLINGRNQTNLGIFRKYVHEHLQKNPAINKDLFLMVRYLAPTDKGIPLEIYCFSKDKKWENYEYIQADILDHLIAAVSYFDLELFELPSGKDLQNLS
ncbi:MAG: mechanosensitive ion channel [Flavobacteriaceae bacterium]|nr:mechanosensitive ion channel [Flavobacteriaceae bacterium]